MIRLCLQVALRSSRSVGQKLRGLHSSSNADFFDYTAGRWLRDESARMAERHLKFNVDALKAVAVSASPGASHVSSMVKIGEGAHNKIFLIKFDTGQEVVARLPNPNAGPARLTTASEVATMDYARLRLGIPVPRVLAWCCRSDESEVGAEYIIMERAKGVELSRVWGDLDVPQRGQFVEELVKLEANLSRGRFNIYGSLFPRDDECITWNPKGVLPFEPIDSDFVIGPCASKEMWGKERRELNLDRGPWTSAEEYLDSVVKREMTWISKYATPPTSIRLGEPKGTARAPAAHLDLLRRYAVAIPSILPRKPELLRPALWHSDLHGCNIFVCDSALSKGEVKITSIIDWQGIWVKPLFTAAKIPLIIRYHDQDALPPGRQMVEFPAHYDALPDDSEEKNAIFLDLVEAGLQKVYEDLTAEHTSAIDYQREHKSSFLLMQAAGSTWESHYSFIMMRQSLLYVQDQWSDLVPNVPCPIHFNADETHAHFLEARKYQEEQDFVAWIRKRLLVHDDEGWVHPEDYEEAVKQNRLLFETGVNGGSNQQERDLRAQVWPFPIDEPQNVMAI